jgi:hypothetical protein
MIWIAPSEEATVTDTLEKRLWDAAEQAVPAPHVAEAEYRGARPEGLLGIIFLRFAEVRLPRDRSSGSRQPGPRPARGRLVVMVGAAGKRATSTLMLMRYGV